jgi:hypothetical protein
MSTLYTIRDWERNFMVAQNRKGSRDHSAKPLAWFATRTKHDGKTFRRLMREKNGMEIYGAWMLILQVAAKCPTHGVLADEDGPLTAEDLALKTGGDEKVFLAALELLSSERFAWITSTLVDRAPTLVDQAPTKVSLHNITVHNTTVQNKTEQNTTPAAVAAGPTARFADFWKVYPRKTGKLKAEKAWKSATRKADADEIVSAAVIFAGSDKGQSGEFCPHPSTWLNEGRWMDDHSTWEATGDSRAPPAEPEQRALTQAEFAYYAKHGTLDGFAEQDGDP